MIRMGPSRTHSYGTTMDRRSRKLAHYSISQNFGFRSCNWGLGVAVLLFLTVIMDLGQNHLFWPKRQNMAKRSKIAKKTKIAKERNGKKEKKGRS